MCLIISGNNASFVGEGMYVLLISIYFVVEDESGLSECMVIRKFRLNSTRNLRENHTSARGGGWIGCHVTLFRSVRFGRLKIRSNSACRWECEQ